MCVRVHLCVCVCAQRGTVTDGGHAVPRAGSQARCMLGCVHRRQEKHRQKLRLSLGAIHQSHFCSSKHVSLCGRVPEYQISQH